MNAAVSATGFLTPSERARLAASGLNQSGLLRPNLASSALTVAAGSVFSRSHGPPGARYMRKNVTAATEMITGMTQSTRRKANSNITGPQSAHLDHGARIT